MEFIKTAASLEGVWLIKPKIFSDQRGFFLESYSQKDFEAQSLDAVFVQDNHSQSVKRGTLRGLHFQKPPYSQSKLVRVTRGKVYDVVLDLRKNSPTFGRWEGFEISAENFLQIFIPRGFAHGFQTLEDNTEFFYKCDNFYQPEAEGGVLWNDPELKINWPVKKPLILEKDLRHPLFREIDVSF